jgi:antibiotic biosynthesis monooxygenase (ABM) superfamily enzyme
MTHTSESAAPQIGPPSKHQLAFMIWLCVFPTLTAINIAFGGWLRTMPSVPRTFILATVAVPVVIYGLMPHVQRLRVRLYARVRPVPAEPVDPASTGGLGSELPGSSSREEGV